jgi:hypothetical protein
MRVELVATKNADNMVLEKLPTLLGQPSQAKVDDPSDGHYHCLISRIDDHLVVWNLGDGGSTLVNGARVAQAALKAGDTLSLGGTEFSVRYEQTPRRYLYGLHC